MHCLCIENKMRKQSPWLSEEEVIEVSRYKVPSFQLRFFRELGVKAILRRDNTVLVLRRDFMSPPQAIAMTKAPRLNLG
jgi:ribosomal protein L5